MGQHPRVQNAMIDAIRQLGAGSGGTRNISGSTHLHALLEQELASLHHKERALVFSSCYVANSTTLSTITRLLPGCIMFSDAKVSEEEPTLVSSFVLLYSMDFSFRITLH